MSLFNEMESCADPDAHEPDLVEIEKHLRKKKYAGQRAKLIKDIPRSKVLHTIDESEQVCERCGSAMVKVGEEFVRTEVQFIHASLKVIDHYREMKHHKEPLEIIPFDGAGLVTPESALKWARELKCQSSKGRFYLPSCFQFRVLPGIKGEVMVFDLKRFAREKKVS